MIPQADDPRVANEPRHRRAWIAHTYDCRGCGHWANGVSARGWSSDVCETGARLYAEMRRAERSG